MGTSTDAPTIICHMATLCIHNNTYNHNGVLPELMDDGVAVGFPKLIPNKDITKLTHPLLTVGHTEGIDLLKVSMRGRIQHKDDDRNNLHCEK